jgi:hypothetical protein
VSIDWQALQTEYLQTRIGLDRLAEQHGVKRAELRKQAALEGWTALKKARTLLAKASEAQDEPPAGVARITDAQRLEQLKTIRDQLTAQLERATGQLDKQVLLHKRRRREMTYDDPLGKGKPVEETVEENVLLEVVDAPVNSANLQRLSTALKTLREITQGDQGDGHGVELVAELMRKLDEESARRNPDCRS